jgi:hypothetical protein
MWSYTSALGVCLVITAVLVTAVFLQPMVVEAMFRYPALPVFKSALWAMDLVAKVIVITLFLPVITVYLKVRPSFKFKFNFALHALFK